MHQNPPLVISRSKVDIMISNPAPQNPTPLQSIQQPLLGNQIPDSVTIEIAPPSQALLQHQSIIATHNQRSNWTAASISCIAAGLSGFIFSGGFLLAGAPAIVCKGLAIAGGASLLCGGMMCECADDHA
jgi:hypothetical protein